MPKINIDRFRWTPEEEDHILGQLLDKAKPKQIIKPELIAAGETVQEAVRRLQQGDEVVGVSSGYRSIDKLTKGFAPGELVVIFGHTSHGKSQLCQNIAVKLAKNDVPSLFVSLEMTQAENTGRLLRISCLEPDDFVGLPIFYPKDTELAPDEVAPLVQEAVANQAKLVVIDHLHYFNRSIDNAQEEIGRLVNMFKRVAVKYHVPILLVSHIVKAADRNKMPLMGHLKGSSFIAQDADIVLAVWRDMEAGDRNLLVKIYKNRNRGFDPDNSTARLAILDEVRLVEPVAI